MTEVAQERCSENEKKRNYKGAIWNTPEAYRKAGSDSASLYTKHKYAS